MEKKSLLNDLWTARWHARKGDASGSLPYLNSVIEKIENDGEPKVHEEPSNVVPIKTKWNFEEPKFIEVEGVSFDSQGNYQTKNGMFDGLVVHYTVSGNTPSSARGVMEWMEGLGYGCMVMDLDGTIYIPKGWDFWKRWDDHCGTSKWLGRDSLSRYFAGMEICCWGKNSKKGPFREAKKGDGYVVPGIYQAYTEAQEKALINFILWAKSRNPEFKIENVVGHDELRAEAGMYGDKQDPGASLSMPMPKFRSFLKSIVG